MSSVPEGRAANQPPSVTTFTPPIGAPFPAAWLRMTVTGSPASCVQSNLLWRERRQALLLRRSRGRFDAVGDRLAQLARQLGVDLTRIASRTRGDFRGEQRCDDAVLVGGPHRAVAAEERRARALFATESERAVAEPVDEPLEPDRDLEQRAAELCD
mgnify:CR=1 FL=1